MVDETSETFIDSIKNDEIVLNLSAEKDLVLPQNNEILPVKPQEYMYKIMIDKENEDVYNTEIIQHSALLYGQKFLPKIYQLPKRAKVLYSSKGLHPNAYTQSVSLLANGLVFNQAVDNVIFDKESSFLEQEKNRVWFKPLNSIEGSLLSSSVYVSNNFYGGILGAESKLNKMKKDSYIKYGSYGAVVDSNSGYRGVNLFSNGLAAGAYVTRYKNKSYAVLNAKVNLNTHESSGQYGIDDYESVLGSISLKTGTNIPLFKNKVILQHYHVYSYTLGRGFDYENAAGMQTGNLNLSNFWTTHGVKISPNKEMKIKPYVNVGMAINLFGKDVKQKINNQEVNSLKLDDYFICSAGLQKEIKERFLGFVELSAKAPGRIYMNTYMGLKWKI